MEGEGGGKEVEVRREGVVHRGGGVCAVASMVVETLDKPKGVRKDGE